VRRSCVKPLIAIDADQDRSEALVINEAGVELTGVRNGESYDGSHKATQRRSAGEEWQKDAACKKFPEVRGGGKKAARSAKRGDKADYPRPEMFESGSSMQGIWSEPDRGTGARR